MSDKKISQLTAATTADGTEPLPIVQSGETKKATGKVVVSGAVSDLAQTWNAAGTTFTGLKLNVTDTASASGSLLLDVQKGGTSQLYLGKDGTMVLGNTSNPTTGFQAVFYSANNGGIIFRDNNSWSGLATTGGSLYLDINRSGAAGNFIVRNSSSFTQQLYLNSSGNLGLGVTPSAWASNFRVVELSGGSLYQANNSQLALIQNAYFDGSSWLYKNTAAATLFIQASGSHQFYTAPSGTAGNALSWTERFSASASAFVINEPGADYDFRIEGDTDANLLFVDASTDRVGIGTNAPGVRLDVNGIIQSKTTSGWSLLQAAATAATETAAFVALPSATVTATNPNWHIGHRFSAHGALAIWKFDGSSHVANYLTLDTSGNLGLGTSTFGTSAAGVFAVKNGTAPTTGVADVLQIYSSDVSAGNTTLSIYTEGTPVSDSTDNAVTKKIAVRINGTLYYLLADTDNS